MSVLNPFYGCCNCYGINSSNYSVKQLRRVLETLLHVSTMFMCPAITPPEVYGFGWNMGHAEHIARSWPDRFWAWSTQKREWECSRYFVFFCQVNNARLCRFPMSQISWNLHTRRGSMSPWILSENICQKFSVRGVFLPIKANFGWPSSTTSHFRPRYLRNDYKSRKVMTGWRAYVMLAFHLYPWNQLSHCRGLQAAYKKQHSWTSPALTRLELQM